jgi:hypothetical protein
MRDSRFFGFVAALGLFAFATMASPAGAADYTLSQGPLPSQAFQYEIRGGVFAHDPFSPEKGSADINAEFLAKLPFATAEGPWSFLVPRVHVGTTVNTVGRTSHVYAGFTWTYDITRQFFVEASFGGAFHNGYTGDVPRYHHNALGCSPLFRESASLGYRLTENWSVMATIEHLSNAGLCTQNRGLTNVGARIGYRF